MLRFENQPYLRPVRQVRIEAIGDNSKNIQIRHAFQTLVRLLRIKSGFDVEQFANKLGFFC